eukprot:GSChrysophyteH1.ASY1.ANO1.2789.1 assembled CDS
MNLSKDLSFILEASQSLQVSKAWDAKAKAKSVNIINGLFLKRRSDIKTAIQSVAYVPKLPELINVHTLHARETRSLTLEQTIHLLCKTFRHNSTHVRVMGLKQLMTICRDVDKKQQLYMQASSATIGISKHGLDTMINLLLQELLYMVRKERDQSVIDVIASALGELGAIDPARVQVSLPSTVQSRGTSNTNPNPSALFAKFQDVDMGLLLLERFLVPGMKATGSASEQDKTGFAIQQILRKLADLGDPGYDKSHGLPESIQNILSKRSMLDIVEPFWSTSYRIEGKPRERKIPIYHPGIEFNQWLAFWTRHLLMQCKENAMTEIFEACGGLLRSRGELCQFILPQIIALYLDTHSDENILLEICHVLSEAGENKGHTNLLNLHMTGTDSISHMSVQAVFTLLDTLASWASSGRSLEKSGKSAPAHTISKASSLTKLMIKLVGRVPKLLLCLASLRIRAHTRALRYFELHSRDLATVKKQKEFAILIPSQLDLLMGIFSKLEDPDALQGVQALRQINGYQNMPWVHSATATGVDLRNFCLIEKGRLRCLIELEQLDSVVDQTLGMVQRLPDLEQDLLPLGVEATWRLQQWDNLEAFLQAGVVSDLDDSFPVSVGRILLDLHKCDRPSFEEHLMETRRQAMSSLSAASMESYGRAYPQLVRLHILSEVEAAYDLIHAVSSGSSEVGEEKKLNIVKSWDWERRLEMTSQSARQRSLLLAVRRTILGAAGLKGEVARNWLGLSDTMRQLGHFDAARVALRSAEQQSGQTSTETLLQECRILKDSGKIHEALNLIEPVEHNVLAIRQLHREHRKIITFSERLYLATQLMVESKVKQGSAIIDRYKCIIEIRPKWPKAHFELAKYYEYLYHTSKAKETADNDAVTLGNTMSPRSGHNWLLMAVVSYIKAISWSQNDSDLQYQGIIIQALPRMLTLFLSFTQLRERDLGPAAQRVYSLRRAQTECCETVKANTGKITPAVWFSCLPQLVSRVEHINRDTVDTIIHIILKVLSAHPKQSVWHVAGDDLVRKATANLGAAGAEEAAMLSDAKLFFRNLIELAVAPAQKKEKKLKWKWPQNLTYTRFIVPMQGVLTAIPRSAEMYMKAFDEWVDVASSKAKPKTVYLQTTDGKTIKFLAKQEKNGDLRKDSRMMEFNTVVNRLFQDDSETRRRNLKLRTYAVVCLNEECGILEWVNSTSCVRHLIQESHSYQPLQYPQVPMREVMESFPAIQTTYGDNMEELVKAYRQLVMDKYRPCFHLWFLEAFPDPTAWFGARTTFTRSMAAWSVVGYLIGLGDRHTENVLLDTTTGECVHVDFDCIFSKGLTLTRPEIVPFRLTPNLVDAMGVTGVEGTFRRTMEVSFTVLKENKETLIAVLEPFLRDPTVAWSRGAAHTSTVVENADAIEALDKISSRLAGRIAPQPRFGLGAVDDESLPLSVRGQVQRLIDEARAEENLAQMYIGWQPWA